MQSDTEITTSKGDGSPEYYKQHCDDSLSAESVAMASLKNGIDFFGRHITWKRREVIFMALRYGRNLTCN